MGLVDTLNVGNERKNARLNPTPKDDQYIAVKVEFRLHVARLLGHGHRKRGNQSEWGCIKRVLQGKKPMQNRLGPKLSR